MQNYEFRVDLRYKRIGTEKHSHVFLLASAQESRRKRSNLQFSVAFTKPGSHVQCKCKRWYLWTSKTSKMKMQAEEKGKLSFSLRLHFVLVLHVNIANASEAWWETMRMHHFSLEERRLWVRDCLRLHNVWTSLAFVLAFVSHVWTRLNNVNSRMCRTH